jgi:hypothetical protein
VSAGLHTGLHSSACSQLPCVCATATQAGSEMATIVRSTHVSECPAGVTLSSSDQGVMNMQPTTFAIKHKNCAIQQ